MTEGTINAPIFEDGAVFVMSPEPIGDWSFVNKEDKMIVDFEDIRLDDTKRDTENMTIAFSAAAIEQADDLSLTKLMNELHDIHADSTALPEGTKEGAFWFHREACYVMVRDLSVAVFRAKDAEAMLETLHTEFFSRGATVTMVFDSLDNCQLPIKARYQFRTLDEFVKKGADVAVRHARAGYDSGTNAKVANFFRNFGYELMHRFHMQANPMGYQYDRFSHHLTIYDFDVVGESFKHALLEQLHECSGKVAPAFRDEIGIFFEVHPRLSADGYCDFVRFTTFKMFMEKTVWFYLHNEKYANMVRRLGWGREFEEFTKTNVF